MTCCYLPSLIFALFIVTAKGKEVQKTADPSLLSPFQFQLVRSKQYKSPSLTFGLFIVTAKGKEVKKTADPYLVSSSSCQSVLSNERELTCCYFPSFTFGLYIVTAKSREAVIYSSLITRSFETWVKIV